LFPRFYYNKSTWKNGGLKEVQGEQAIKSEILKLNKTNGGLDFLTIYVWDTPANEVVVQVMHLVWVASVNLLIALKEFCMGLKGVHIPND